MEGYMDIIYIKNANEYIILPHLISIITLTKGYSSMYWKKKKEKKKTVVALSLLYFNAHWMRKNSTQNEVSHWPYPI